MSEGLPPVAAARPGASGPSGPAVQVSGRGGLGSFGPLVQTMDLARHTAVGRMATECAEIGGHGVVGVRLTRGSFPLGGPQFTAIGTHGGSRHGHHVARPAAAPSRADPVGPRPR